MSSEDIHIIMRQTDYDAKTAQAKLQEFKTIKNVILDYLKPNAHSKEHALPPPKLNFQQEMYRQIRVQMDNSTKAFQEKQLSKLQHEFITPQTAPAEHDFSA